MNVKKLLLSCLSGVLFTANLMAADLCVNESGSGGCFSSISAAITAASDGDRILIQPKTGGVPYVENLSINKSIQLLSNQEGVMWDLTGNITITPAIGRNISIMHMKNTTGNITSTGHSPVGARCKVNIMNCELMQGYINFDHNYFDVNVASNIVNNGYIAVRYGNVIGNQVSASWSSYMFYNFYGWYTLINYNPDFVPTNDTLYIIGNMIKNTSTHATSYNSITVHSNSQFFYVANNYCYTVGSPHQGIGIFFSSHKNSMLGTNSIHNNTMIDVGLSSATYNPISIYENIAGLFDIKNNLSCTPNKPTNSSGYNVYNKNNAANPTVAFSYNFTAPLGSTTNIVNNGTNNFTSNTTINIVTGQLNVSTDAINGGYPDLTYYDLDLTVNDVGAYGGSFSLDNFHPISGAARVYFVNAPRTILQSGTLNIKANAFDR